MQIVLLSSVFLLYTALLVAFFLKKNTLLAILLVTLSLFHDFIFIHFSYYFSETVTYIAKSWQELLLVLGLIAWFIRVLKKNSISKNKNILSVMMILFFLMFIGFVSSLRTGDNFPDILLGIRNYIFPILLPTVLLLNSSFKNIALEKIIKYILLIGLLFVFYGFYQRKLFLFYGGGEIIPDFTSELFYKNVDKVFSKTLWYHKFFELDYMITGWYDRVRNFQLRATSFFVSPLIFSLLLNLCLTIVLARFFYGKKNKNKFYLILFCIIFLYGVQISQVRTSLVFVSISVLVILFKKYFGAYNWKILLIPLALILLTFFSISYIGDLDNSARYRLVQYKMMLQNFTILGTGIGSKEATVKYDSMVISSVYAFGLFSILFFYIHYKLYSMSVQKTEAFKKSYLYYYVVLIVSCFMAFLYFAVFQYTLSSGPLKLFYYLVFFWIGSRIHSTNELKKTKASPS